MNNNMKRMSLNDCVDLNKSTQSMSEFVIIDSERNSGNRASSFNLALEGGFLTHIGNGMDKCKKIVANNLSLVIMADANQTMK